MKHYIFLINILEKDGWGGCEKRLLDYFTRMNYSENKITLITTKDIFNERFKRYNLPIDLVILPFKLEGSFRERFYNIYKLFKSLKPKAIVFVHNAFMMLTIAEFLAGFFVTKGNIFCLEVLGAPKPDKKTTKKYFGLIPGIGFWWYKQMFPIVLRGWLCKKILAVSNEVKSRLTDWYYYPKRRIVIAYHGVNLKQFYPDNNIKSDMRKKLNIPKEDIVIINHSRLSKQKCLHRLINAFGLLSEKYKNCWLIIIGEGEEKTALENLAEKKINKNKIKFLGFIEDVSDYLRMSDIFVLSSNNEGFGHSLLEAMAVGLVVISTKTPGPNELIEHNKSGILVENSAEGVFCGLNQVLGYSEDRRKKITENAKKFVRENFDLNKKAKTALDFMEINTVNYS